MLMYVWQIFQWYQDKSKIAYPSTLYVTLKGIVPPSSVQPAVRSMFATQKVYPIVQ